MVAAPEPPLQQRLLIAPKQQLVAYAVSVAEDRHLNSEHFTQVINCESSWKITATGDNGNSHGLVQIHEPSHPEVTLDQANDPTYAIGFMADAWENGKENQWSCYRILKAKGWN